MKLFKMSNKVGPNLGELFILSRSLACDEAPKAALGSAR
jgi:hypothetical protein